MRPSKRLDKDYTTRVLRVSQATRLSWAGARRRDEEVQGGLPAERLQRQGHSERRGSFVKKIRQLQTDLPKHIADAIRDAWPDGVIDMAVDWDDAPFWELYPKLRAAFSRIRGSVVCYEREPEGGPRWSETSNPDEDPPDWNDESRSYWLFFVSSMDERFTFATDSTEPDEEGHEERFSGEGRIGYVVAVSLVAPFAVVTLDQMEVFENGSRSEPDVDPHIFGPDGRKVDPEDYYRELVDEAGLMVLKALRPEIVRVLGQFAVGVIPEGDLERPVPWLRASKDVVVGDPVTVRDAFFFRSV